MFDNASDGVAGHIPTGNRGNILLTSRNPSLARLVSAEDVVEVAGMDEGDAIFLLRSAGLDETSTQTRQAARPIVKDLCCLPLAVDQAGAAIMSGLCSIDNYKVAGKGNDEAGDRDCGKL